MPFVQVDRANITSLAQKKSKVATTTKPDENVPEPGENVPKPGSSPQAPGPPLSNVDGKVTTTTVATSATGKRVRVPLANSNNKMP